MRLSYYLITYYYIITLIRKDIKIKPDTFFYLILLTSAQSITNMTKHLISKNILKNLSRTYTCDVEIYKTKNNILYAAFKNDLPKC